VGRRINPEFILPLTTIALKDLSPPPAASSPEMAKDGTRQDSKGEIFLVLGSDSRHEQSISEQSRVESTPEGQENPRLRYAANNPCSQEEAAPDEQTKMRRLTLVYQSKSTRAYWLDDRRGQCSPLDISIGKELDNQPFPYYLTSNSFLVSTKLPA
jgi:hypothetical protein